MFSHFFNDTADNTCLSNSFSWFKMIPRLVVVGQENGEQLVTRALLAYKLKKTKTSLTFEIRGKICQNCDINV